MASDRAASFHEKVNQLIDNANFHEAFMKLREECRSMAENTLKAKLDNTEDTYRYLIHYMVEGFDDKGRENMLKGIAADLRLINDSLKRKSALKDSPDIYSSTRRFEDIRKESFGSRLSQYRGALAKASLAVGNDGLNLLKERDETLCALFSHVWTMFGDSDSEYRALTDSFGDDTLPFEYKSQMVSALFLGSLSYYDPRAFTSLLDIYEADYDERLSARALVAIMLIMAAHPDRIRENATLTSRLELWKDSIMTYRRMRETLMGIIRARDTQRISSKMQNEVLPELMKLRPEILSKLKNITGEADLEMLDVNPEWEELMNKNGLADKLKELTEIQMDGGDVMMMAFSNLKTFPFFNNAANWFLPFSSDHSEVIGEHLSAGMASILNMDGIMCDSDRYSFALSLARMPEEQRAQVSARMDSQMAQLKEAMADKKLKSGIPEFDSEVTRYVRNIYRFFKLFRRKDDLPDPFVSPLDFMSLPVVAEILEDDEILNLVGEFYFKRGYYAEALPILSSLEKSAPANPLLWEKIGYCHNALDNLDEALIWYKKAELLNPDSQWLTKKLALCNRLLGHYDEAAEYYSKALQQAPDNYGLLMSSGKCRLETGNVKEALADFYHADYIKPGKPATLRAIAWGALRIGDFGKSIDCYSRLMDMPDHTANDLLNQGHALLLSGNLKEALRSYLESVRTKGYGIAKFETDFIKDIPDITSLGANPSVMKLLLEKVRYETDV